MKKLLFIIICLLMTTGCNDQELSDDNEQEYGDYFSLEIIKTEGCKNQVTEYYQKIGQDRKVYFVCFDEINYKITRGKTITLKYFFDNVNQSFDASMEQITEQMELVDIYKDGGTVLYQKDNYRVLVCKKEGGPRDVYFGDITLEYENDYCIYK